MTTPANIATLIDQLGHENARSRGNAAQQLGDAGPEARGALLPLCERIGDAAEDNLVRWKAATAIRAIGPRGDAILRALILAHDSQVEHIRKSAVHALGGLTPEAKDDVPVILELLKSQQANVREAAVYALGRIGPAVSDVPEWKAVDAVKMAVRDSVANVRLQALVALKAVSGSLEGTVTSATDLIRRPGSESPNNPTAARRRPENSTSLYELLKGETGTMKRAAAYAMSMIDPNENGNAVSHLIEALKEPDPKVRAAAARSLGAMGESASRALPALLTLLKDKDDQVRSTVFEAIHKVAKKNPQP
ncbi:MAG: HEAT repeat domain-containing protein [Sumerlaeia bacterium]